MKLQDMLDVRKLAELVADGYVRERAHPEWPTLRILNYSERSVYERMWTHETLTCRGLIYDAGSGEVVARSWPKFFNWGELEPGMPDFDRRAPCEVTDKQDGSLGVIFRNPYTGGLEVATRGSFISEQALIATQELLPRLLSNGWEPRAGWTTLVEIIYPKNRIVLDYGDRRGLTLLGGVHTETGAAKGPNHFDDWPGSVTRTFEAGSLYEALSMPPRPNAEGLVLRYEDGLMVKLKQDDYVRLHKIVTGLTPARVWETMAANRGSIEQLLKIVPDEWHGWLTETANGLGDAYAVIERAAKTRFSAVVDDLLGVESPERKDFAVRAIAATKDAPGLRPLLFLLYDGRDTDEAIWKQIRPRGDAEGPRQFTEDTA